KDGIRDRNVTGVQTCALPIFIGIVKRNYADSAVFITATKKEVDELLESGCEIIAMDATSNKRPKEKLEELVAYIRETAPHVELMADCSTVKEAKAAEGLGFDYIGTTLYGYTEKTKGKRLYANDFEFLKEMVKSVQKPVVAEGNVMTPEMMQTAFKLG